MRFEPLGLEEWYRRWKGAAINLDSSGAPYPYPDFDPPVGEKQDLIELEEELVGVLSSLYGVEEERIALAFGTQNANSLVLLTLLEGRDRLLVERPIYEPMRKVAEQVCHLEDFTREMETGYRPNIEQLDSLLSEGAKMIMLTNIHNPSGAMIGDSDMKAIMDLAQDNRAMVLCDEIYREMSYGNPPKGVFELGEHGISTNGFTKMYGLGGLRIGWMIGSQEVAREVELTRLALSSHLPSHSLSVAVEALGRRDWFRERMLGLARENIKVLSEWAKRESRFSFMMPEGGLMFQLPLPQGIDDLEFSEFLLREYDTAVCPGTYFGVRGQIRVTFSCAPEIFGRGLENISSALTHLS